MDQGMGMYKALEIENCWCCDGGGEPEGEIVEVAEVKEAEKAAEAVEAAEVGEQE